MSELLAYITGKLSKFIMHSSQRFRDVLFWKIWQNNIVPSSTLLIIDFSENLSIPIQREPQTLYFCRKQISIHCGVALYRDEDFELKKLYCGHLSEDKDHDQVFVRKSLEDYVTFLPINETLITRSDNAQHFKSAENFHDYQEICNKIQKKFIRVYGQAGHSKCEVDSCGGHFKNPVRKGIANNVHIVTSDEAANYLSNHYENKTNPEYYPSVINPDTLQEERTKRLYKDYKTVSGSDSFHVMIFSPDSKTFLASKQLCVCSNCLDMRFEDCKSFRKYEPVVGQLNEKATRSKSMVTETSTEGVSSMVTENSIFAVRAENVRTNYFLLQCVAEEKMHMDAETPIVDKAGNVIYYGTNYITAKYLDISDFNMKYHEFKLQQKNFIYVVSETVFFPQVPMIYISKPGTTFRISNDIILELQVRSSLSSS